MTTTPCPTPAALCSRRHPTARLFTALVAAGLAAGSTANADTITAIASGSTVPASGVTAGTAGFTDLSLVGSWTGGTLNNNGTDLASISAASAGAVESFGMSADMSFQGLTLSSVRLYGNTVAGVDNKTITLGAGGITFLSSSVTNSFNGIFNNLAVGTTNQTWTLGQPVNGNDVSNVTGSSTITLVNQAGKTNGTLKLRSASAFTGNWVVDAVTLSATNNTALGKSGLILSTIELRNGGTLAYSGANNLNIANNLTLSTGGGTLRSFSSGATASTTTFSGTVSGGTTAAPETLSFDSAGTNSTFNLTGSLANHVGAMRIKRSDATDIINLNNTVSFVLGANHVVDGMDTATTALIGSSAAGGGVNLTQINFNGTFSIDLTGAAVADGNSWKLVDATNLSEAYGLGFSVASTALDAFSKTGTVWSLADGANTWSFDQATGALSVSAVPEPSTYAALAGLGILGFAAYRRRGRNGV